jgi:hypothetical protein
VRRRVVWLLTFLGGLFYLLEFLLPARAPDWLGGFENPLTPCLPSVTSLLVVVGAMAFLLGPLNLARSHLGTLLRRRPGRLESLVFLVFLVASIVAASCEGADIHWALDALYNALFYGVQTAFFASSMALLAFYLVSAAHRAFRINNLEAGLMMASAVVILLGQVPLGDWLTQALPESLQLRHAAQWILAVPNTGVQRAVEIGVCGGAFAAGFRQWLGLGARAG